ncbi:MAG: hypothetical protein ACETWG_11075 [Candidatus Neomarinimicrobiota bacterium]
MVTSTKRLALIGFAFTLLVISGCAPGNERFVAEAAGFWAGLWHGLICVVTFIISLFSDTVHMYEVNNTGGWYNFGFLLGAAIFFGSGSSPFSCKKRAYKMGDREWEKIGEKVEEKVRRAIRDWAEEEEGRDKEWEEIGRKIEEKIKRELRNWAEK